MVEELWFLEGSREDSMIGKVVTGCSTEHIGLGELQLRDGEAAAVPLDERPKSIIVVKRSWTSRRRTRRQSITSILMSRPLWGS